MGYTRNPDLLDRFIDWFSNWFPRTVVGKLVMNLLSLASALLFSGLLLTGVLMFFFFPASQARNSLSAAMMTPLVVGLAVLLGYFKRSHHQASYGWIELLAGMVWTWISITYFLNDPPDQPLVVSRGLSFVGSVYLLRQGVDNIWEGGEKLKQETQATK